MHDLRGLIGDGLKGLRYNFKKNILPGKRNKPKVINMMANDICNSKCSMCNIWKQKLDFEISPEELKSILKDSLFNKVENVGITGGEPTLRKDLPELYEVVCQSLPSLKRVSIITNAINKKDVIKRIIASAKVCEKYGVEFGLMVSLDGYKEVHDNQRGRIGNFDSAIEVISFFKENTKIPVSYGCTITKSNVWGIDDLLFHMRESDLYGRYRVAEFINRLYNNDLVEEIRSFSDDEIYQITIFYEKLINEYEKNIKYKRTYKSIQNVINGGTRLISCPYQNDGIVLDSRGELLYCAPKSKNLGNAQRMSAIKIFKSNRNEKKRILEEDCRSCIHDYHSEATLRETLTYIKQKIFEKLFTIKYYFLLKNFLPNYFRLITFTKNIGNTILITGWYGTETVGDKAILGGIINSYLNENPKYKFKITGIYPYVVKQTIKELGISKIAEAVPLYSSSIIKDISSAKEVVMGGGPLMDIESLAIVLWVFKLGKKFQKRTILFGCGIGPIKTNKSKRAIIEISKLSDDIRLRDLPSKNLLSNISPKVKNKIKIISDPAIDYVSGLIPEIKEEYNGYVALFLRDWPDVYSSFSKQEFQRRKDKFYSDLAQALRTFCMRYNMTPAFYSMHNFSIGGDDRDFYRNFISKYYKSDNYVFEKRLSTVESILKAMKSSRLNIAMRYHSVVFSSKVGANFIALDYTGGGKIKGYLSDCGMLDNMFSMEGDENLSKKLIKKMEQRIKFEA